MSSLSRKVITLEADLSHAKDALRASDVAATRQQELEDALDAVTSERDEALQSAERSRRHLGELETEAARLSKAAATAEAELEVARQARTEAIAAARAREASLQSEVKTRSHSYDMNIHMICPRNNESSPWAHYIGVCSRA